MTTLQTLRRRINVARGAAPGDLLLRGGQIVDVLSGTVRPADVVIADGVIAGVGTGGFTAEVTVDLDGAVVAPGLIDAHMHIESTLLTPAEFARVVVPRGTSAVIADPHEIGNVLGIPGIEAMIAASAGIPLDCWFMAPSCVPASPFESAGAVLDPKAIERLLESDAVLGLAEMMNFPGVLGGDEEVLSKVLAARGRGAPVDGHCPGLTGADLVAYAAAGIETEHECVTLDEALERQQVGMLVLVREGTMARNLDAMLPGIVDGTLRHWSLCTDDILPADLLSDGHIDGLLARLVAAGVPAPVAVRHASYVPAQHFGRASQRLRRQGVVAPGWAADLVVFDDLVSFRAQLTVKNGAVVARDGAYLHDAPSPPVPTGNTVRLGPVAREDFTLRPAPESFPVIGVIPDQIVTRHDLRAVSCAADGQWQFDADDDVALIACIQRHEPTGRLGLGLVSGFGFRGHGAFGTSVGHDAHNLLVTGTSPDEMLACALALADLGGGCVAMVNGAVRATMPLPVAGLLSTAPATEVVAQQATIDAVARELGCTLGSPFGTLSFLALSVIPSLKITDLGLFDVERFELVTT